MIVNAGGDAVTTPQQLVHIVERTMHNGNSITLEVERQHHMRHVILQW